MQLKVIHSFPEWLPQTQTWMYHQARYLPANRVECHVACDRTANLEQFAIPNLHTLGGYRSLRFCWDKVPNKLGLRRHSPFLVGLGRRLGAAVVHSHFGPVGWGNLASVRRLPAKHVVTFYGCDVSMVPVQQHAWRERYLELFGRVDRVLCEGPFMARAITQLGCPPDKIHIHHLGVEVDSIGYAPREWLPGSPLRVLIAASFAEKKGIPYALAALGQLRRDLAVEVTLIGDTRPNISQDLDEKRRILSVIEEQQLGSVVRLLGYRSYSTVFEEAYKHHVFLAPSVTATDGDTEGGAPVSVIEMAATGLPIISTTHCDIPNVVKHGVTGLLAEERDVSALLAHLRWLVDHSNAWRPMLDAGRRHIEAEFNARTQGERLSGHYELLVGSTSRSAGS